MSSQLASSQVVTKLLSSCFFLIPHFSSILPNLSLDVYTKKRTLKKLYCTGEKCYVVLCPPLRTAPPTGEAAKLTDDVKQITSYNTWIELWCRKHFLPIALVRWRAASHNSEEEKTRVSLWRSLAARAQTKLEISCYKSSRIRVLLLTSKSFCRRQIRSGE
jgi:hypothetical protein